MSYITERGLNTSITKPSGHKQGQMTKILPLYYFYTESYQAQIMIFKKVSVKSVQHEGERRDNLRESSKRKDISFRVDTASRNSQMTTQGAKITKNTQHRWDFFSKAAKYALHTPPKYSSKVTQAKDEQIK